LLDSLLQEKQSNVRLRKAASSRLSIRKTKQAECPKRSKFLSLSLQ